MRDADDRSIRTPKFRDSIEAIKFYMAECGLEQLDLIPIIGSRSKVSEVLSGTRSLTMPMARTLHRHLGIPAEALLKEHTVYAGSSDEEIYWRRLPLSEMAKCGWIKGQNNLCENAEKLVAELVKRMVGSGMDPCNVLG